MESVLQCDTFGSFDSLNFQQNDACFSSILEDFQDRTQLDFGFNFPGESLEFTETTSVASARRTPNVGEKRKIDSLENFWDSEYFLPSNDCNFVGTYSSHDDYSYTTSPATENFDFNNVKVKTLDSGFSLDKSSELCTANHVHKKQKIEASTSGSPIPNVSSPPFSQRPNSSPSSPQKTTKRRAREVVRRSTPIPILCPDSSLPTSSSPTSLSSDPTLIPNVFEFKKTISELDDTTRTVYRDTLLQLARNAESGVFEPSSHNNGMNFESLLMRMMFSFSVPSISPSFFSTAASAPSTNIDRSHTLLAANHQNYYNNLQFVPIISSRPNSVIAGKMEATSLPHHPPRADPFFQKNSSYSVPNFTLVKPFPIPMSTSASIPAPNTYRGANDNAKQTVISRHLPIRVL